MTHTSGPWKVGRDPFNVVSTSGHMLARILPGGVFDGNRFRELFDDEREANARLMAAAPDLLAFAQEIAGVTDDPFVARQAKAVIAKALGTAVAS